MVEFLSKENDIEIDILNFLKVISHELTMTDLVEIAHKIQSLIDRHIYSGIIVTIGTNALEDVAYFVSLVIHTPIPIVFTGAHFPQKSLSFDGEKNLYNALQIANSQEAIGLGVLVSFYDYVVSAREAVKSPCGLPTNFADNGLGIIGYVVGGKFILRSKPIYPNTILNNFKVDKLNHLPRVVVIYGHIGIENIFVEAAINNHVAGIISAGFGKGYQPKSVTSSLKKAVEQGITVVRCSRSGFGLFQ